MSPVRALASSDFDFASNRTNCGPWRFTGDGGVVFAWSRKRPVLPVRNPLPQCRCLLGSVVKARRHIREIAGKQVLFPSRQHCSLRNSGSDGGYRTATSHPDVLAASASISRNRHRSHDCRSHCEPIATRLRSRPPRRTNGLSSAHVPPARRTPNERLHQSFHLERELHDSG